MAERGATYTHGHHESVLRSHTWRTAENSAGYLLGHLATLPRAAVVVEDRFSSVMKLDRVRPAVVLDGLGECQARFPSVPIIFCENRPLAQEWAYRFLAAALHELGQEKGGAARLAALPQALPLEAPGPSTADVRAWARHNGIEVPDRGRLRPDVWNAYTRATRTMTEES